MKQANNLFNRFLSIKSECAFVTAADAKYVPYLFNTLASIHLNFPDHPIIYIFDLGMSYLQRRELSTIPWVKLVSMDKFVPHWKVNWSWKPYILSQVIERYVLYFDSANIVVCRPLYLWFLSIEKNGYLVVSNRQKLVDIVPSNYWKLFGLAPEAEADKKTFGAGLIGYDTKGPAGNAIKKSLNLTVDGFNLGRSRDETNPIFDTSVEHDCVCFRADQTLLNLAFYEYLDPSRLQIRNERRYCGYGGRYDHPRQYIWYAHRHLESLIYFWKPLTTQNALFYLNRCSSYIIVMVRRHGRRLINLITKH